jgi:hypothetical protein
VRVRCGGRKGEHEIRVGPADDTAGS